MFNDSLESVDEDNQLLLSPDPAFTAFELLLRFVGGLYDEGIVAGNQNMNARIMRSSVVRHTSSGRPTISTSREEKEMSERSGSEREMD